MSWNPWKATAIGMALVAATALVTGLVVANWSGKATVEEPSVKQPERTATSRPATQASRPASSAPTRTAAASAPAPAQPAVPTQSAIDACNQQAASEVQHNKTVEVVKDAAIGAVVGAAVGAAGGAIADGGKGAGKGAIIGGVVGTGGGVLYGINENRKADERYRAAYSACMKNRGYAS